MLSEMPLYSGFSHVYKHAGDEQGSITFHFCWFDLDVVLCSMHQNPIAYSIASRTRAGGTGSRIMTCARYIRTWAYSNTALS